MELTIKKPQTVNAKTLKLHLKVTDSFTAQLVSDKGEVIHEQDDGYVPSFMPGDHCGDYVILDIDIDTGKVTNWCALSPEDIESWISKED
jgi:hypothetical protein